jgi:hypothetical protein
MAKTVIAAALWMLVGIMVVPFLVQEVPSFLVRQSCLVREFAQPVVRQPTNAEGYNAQRTQSAANNVSSEQKPLVIENIGPIYRPVIPTAPDDPCLIGGSLRRCTAPKRLCIGDCFVDKGSAPADTVTILRNLKGSDYRVLPPTK